MKETQSGNLDQPAPLPTPFQAYYKKPCSNGKFALLKDPTAAIYSDVIEGLLTPMAPQILGSMQMQQGAFVDKTSSINPAPLVIRSTSDQRSKLESPLQKSAEKQPAVDPDLNLDLPLEQPVDLQDMRMSSSNDLTKKKPQANSTLIKAQVHVSTTTMAHSIEEQDTQLIATTTDNPHGLQLPIIFEDQSGVPKDSLFIETHLQLTPMLHQSQDTQGLKRRPEACSGLFTTELEDSWLQSISITNDKDLIQALGLRTFVWSKCCSLVFGQSLRPQEAIICSSAPQQ
ncbi:hypothetical protein NDU88_000758 [Pleurodeles waltl]|uniref:Uncharacterized protein n=1 Tax=Pleurodeles waltl TaxID=8319 RepID=A0AAV7L7G9_PLEWA|nr:hypothetical protein NDU88_000758 [Pleurodeles waltl]